YGVQTFLKMYIVESTTAMTIPWRTPTKATPSAHATASANSEVRTLERRRRAATSNRLIDAAMITAARTGWGIDWTRPGTKMSIASTRLAATRPVSWVFAPDWKATAVRDPLVLTGKPEKRPAARLADPMPASSWLPSTS